MGDSLHTCDNCGYEASGYSVADLRSDGWKWHKLPDGKATFVMCGGCEREFASRRESRDQADGDVG